MNIGIPQNEMVINNPPVEQSERSTEKFVVPKNVQDTAKRLIEEIKASGYIGPEFAAFKETETFAKKAIDERIGIYARLIASKEQKSELLAA